MFSLRCMGHESPSYTTRPGQQSFVLYFSFHFAKGTSRHQNVFICSKILPWLSQLSSVTIFGD